MKILFLALPNEWEETPGKTGGGFETRIVPSELLSAATVLSQEGHEVKVCDALAAGLREKGIRRFIQEYSPEWIILSAFDRCRWAMRPAKKVLENFPDKTFALLGGHNISMIKEILMAHDNVIFSTYGDPEQALPKALQDQGRMGSAGIIYRSAGGDLSIPAQPALIENLDSLPVADRDLINLSLYKRFPHEDAVDDPMDIVFSRGCPYGCIFCLAPLLYGKKFHAMSPPRVRDEIVFLKKKYRKRYFHFQDPLFSADPKWVHEFCSLIRPHDIRWSCQTRADLTSHALLEAMGRSGCYSILYGIESLNPKILRGIKKNIAVSKIEDTLKRTKDLGIETRLSYIVGLPGSNEKVIREDLSAIIRLDPDFVQFHSIVAFPGTPLFDEYQDAGSRHQVSGISYDVMGHPFIPKGFSDYKQIEQLTAWCYRIFYLRFRFLLRPFWKPGLWIRYLKGFPLFLKVIQEKKTAARRRISRFSSGDGKL